MVIMPPSEAEDSCTVVKTVENREGPLNKISVHWWVSLSYSINRRIVWPDTLITVGVLRRLLFQANHEVLQLV